MNDESYYHGQRGAAAITHTEGMEVGRRMTMAAMSFTARLGRGITRGLSTRPGAATTTCGWVIRQVFSMLSLSFANTKLLLTTVCTFHLLGPPLHRQPFATLPHHPTHWFIRSLRCRTRRRPRHLETTLLSFCHQVLHSTKLCSLHPCR